MSAHPTVSIVIVCMNRLDNLYPCLRGIEKCCSGEFETLVVAYQFDESAFTRVKEDFPRVKFISSSSTRGFSENNNLALKQAEGEYCFVLNDDTLISEDVIGHLVRDF